MSTGLTGVPQFRSAQGLPLHEYRLRQLLGIIGAADQWIAPDLAQAGPEQVQDHLRVLGSFLSYELFIASRVRASASVGIGRSWKL